ncbi:Hypothetical protein LUCI_1801 [Lucifera butyrica]|uniref:L,D-TPase catalytic domain-containing protein n=1 Tax=Lucifera butyrica TaxID=1351585 RepID=A0A498R619_9FIRM|nr:L,D-transpeptidase family protein [Lucifera butyrica]VBB06565.1 Hypothetical protein LUCI_1801 [Lucifera butyrica]
MDLRILYPPCSVKRVVFTEDSVHPMLNRIQTLLKNRGLYQGEYHGKYDAATQEAVALFQEGENLKVTGNVNPITVCRLEQAVTWEVVPVKNKMRSNFALPRANILITKSTRQLTLFNGNSPFRHFPVAIGKPSTPTPSGNYAVATKVINPGGMLGTRWLGLTLPSYGIHGTSAPWLIGKMVSHGCIRMYNENVEELFVLVSVGTPVYIRD